MHYKNRFGFVPRNLEIEGRPELTRFPLNVLFVQYGVRNGWVVSGSAVYEPEVDSYGREGDVMSMRYRNAHGGESWLLISFDEAKGLYKGEKWVDGECVREKSDTDWNRFFGEFTGLVGVVASEICELKPYGPVVRHQPSTAETAIVPVRVVKR